VLSHELRNPLASISGAAELLAPESLVRQEQVCAARAIRRQAAVMKVMLGELLDVWSLRQGRLALRRERTSARARRPVWMRRWKRYARIESGHHTLELNTAEEEISLDADPTRLSQVLSNLLANAAKYTPAPGRIALSVRPEGREAVFEVTDDGIGMDPESIETMFEMFVQSERAHERANGGMGIGLALVRNIVELHGDADTGHSDGLGLGCRFTVRIPSARSTAGGSALVTADDSEARRRLLLLADDNADALWGLEQMLSRAGFEVETVNNGIDALRVAQVRRPDAAVLDIGMPGMDGHQVARRMRAEPPGHELVLIAATGWGQSADRAAALEAGFDEHVAKPVTASDLQRLFRTHDSGRQAHGLPRYMNSLLP
jgi:two-component system CheB/CheR fusion protein